LSLVRENQYGGGGDIPATGAALGGSGQLNLDAIDTVDAVYEEDEDEDKGYLQPVL
jgi:hypothetical protein